MKALILVAVFAVHAVVFLRQYMKRPDRMHYVLLVAGFTHLLAYYVYRSWAYYTQWGADLVWMSYLRWSGIAICALGTPPLVVNLYSRIRAKVGRRRLVSPEGEQSDRL